MKTNYLVSVLAVFVLCSCNAFMTGWTQHDAINKYHLVTGNEDNFGDRRIKYNKGFHSRSDLTCILATYGNPNMIYEYITEKKIRGIRMFYSKMDSTFVIEEPKKGKLQSVIKERRRMNEIEKITYERLKEKN